MRNEPLRRLKSKVSLTWKCNPKIYLWPSISLMVLIQWWKKDVGTMFDWFWKYHRPRQSATSWKMSTCIISRNCSKNRRRDVRYILVTLNIDVQVCVHVSTNIFFSIIFTVQKRKIERLEHLFPFTYKVSHGEFELVQFSSRRNLFLVHSCNRYQKYPYQVPNPFIYLWEWLALNDE